MPTDPAAPATKRTSFLADLVAHGEKLVAADLPTDMRKVLGALVSWVESGGKFVEPEVFDPQATQQIAEEQAESARLADRLAQVEAQLAAQTAVAQTPPAPGVAATPVAPAPVAPAPEIPAIPGIVQAPPVAADAPVAPIPPASE